MVGWGSESRSRIAVSLIEFCGSTGLNMQPDRQIPDTADFQDPSQVTDSPPAPLRLPERFGVYLWWPQDGTDWIHADDVQLAERLIPSNRIFQRRFLNEEYSVLLYGEWKLRVRPTMWLEVPTDGYLVGDQVEVRSRMGKRRPRIATIREIRWNRPMQVIEYYLDQCGREIPQIFRVDDIQPAFRLDQPMTIRQMELAARSRIR